MKKLFAIVLSSVLLLGLLSGAFVRQAFPAA